MNSLVQKGARGKRAAVKTPRSWEWGMLLLVLGLPNCGGSAPVSEVSRPAAAPAPPARPSRPPPALGELSPQDVVFGLNLRHGGPRDCFARHPDQPLVVRISWEVDASGQPHGIAAEANDAPREVTRCLEEWVEERTFPAREGRSRAQWTFVANVLKADGGKKARSSKRRKVRDQGATLTPSGRLSTWEVDSVVHAAFPLYGHCLRAGVNENSKLSGALVLRWSIDERGRVSDVVDAGSDLSSRRVIDCAAEAFYALRFDPPRHGAVEVTYPILLNTD